MPLSAYSTKAIKNYRADIDGLRAVAIITVVLFHFFPRVLPAGFIGVDIFFVISGYLMSSIVFKWLTDGTFSAKVFYLNRLKRIFPALIIVLSSCLLGGYFMLLPDEFSMLGKHTAAGFGFVQNIVLYMESGYFDADSRVKPLLHLWSLGVEEQFYIVFPIVMLFLWRLKARIFFILVMLALLSFAANIFFVQTNPSGAFYLPHNRIWEPLIGCLLAYLSHFHAHSLGSLKEKTICGNTVSLQTIVASLGLLLLVLALTIIKKKTPFPGWHALLPVGAATCFIMAGPTSFINRKILSNTLMISIGLISYPLYLWHWPMYSFAYIIEAGTPKVYIRLLLIALSVVLSVLTYLFIEKSFRLKPSRAKYTFLVAAAVALSLLGLSVFSGRVHPYIIGTYKNPHMITSFMNAVQDGDYFAGLTKRAINGAEVHAVLGTKNTLFYGDSLSIQYGPRAVHLMQEAHGSNRGVIFFRPPAPLPDLISNVQSGPVATPWVKQFATLARNESIDTIVIAASWFPYFTPSFWKKEEGTDEDAKQSLRNFMKDVQDMVMALPDDKKIVIVSPPLGGYAMDPKQMVKRHLWPFEMQIVIKHMSRSGYLRENALAYQFLKDLADKKGANFIDPTAYQCLDDICPSIDPTGRPLYKDPTHFNASFVREHITYLDDAMLGK